jgi:hypothetical protein
MEMVCAIPPYCNVFTGITPLAVNCGEKSRLSPNLNEIGINMIWLPGV